MEVLDITEISEISEDDLLNSIAEFANIIAHSGEMQDKDGY